MLIWTWKLTFYFWQQMCCFRWITSFILKIATKYPIWAITVSHCFKSTFSWCNYCTLIGTRSVSCVFLISSHETLKSNDLRKLIFTAASRSFVMETGFLIFLYLMSKIMTTRSSYECLTLRTNVLPLTTPLIAFTSSNQISTWI